MNVTTLVGWPSFLNSWWLAYLLKIPAAVGDSDKILFELGLFQYIQSLTFKCLCNVFLAKSTLSDLLLDSVVT